MKAAAATAFLKEKLVSVINFLFETIQCTVHIVFSFYRILWQSIMEQRTTNHILPSQTLALRTARSSLLKKFSHKKNAFCSSFDFSHNFPLVGWRRYIDSQTLFIFEDKYFQFTRLVIRNLTTLYNTMLFFKWTRCTRAPILCDVQYVCGVGFQ